MINKTSRLLYLPVFAAGLPFALITVVTVAQLATRSATLSEVSTPFLMMTALSAFILLLLGGTIGGLALQESASIRRLVDGEYWARWPQYRSEQDWRSFAERQYKQDLEGAGFSWLPVIVVTVFIVIGAGVPALLSQRSGGISADTLITGGAALGVFYIFLLGLTTGGGLLKKRQAETTYRRRLSSPVPTVYIGKSGLYDEDKGYQEFRGLNTRLVGVEYRESSPASLNFSLIVRYSMGAGQSARRMGVTESVRVLADYREQAKALAERFEREGLIKK